MTTEEFLDAGNALKGHFALEHLLDLAYDHNYQVFFRRTDNDRVEVKVASLSKSSSFIEPTAEKAITQAISYFERNYNNDNSK